MDRAAGAATHPAGSGRWRALPALALSLLLHVGVLMALSGGKSGVPAPRSPQHLVVMVQARPAVAAVAPSPAVVAAAPAVAPAAPASVPAAAPTRAAASAPASAGERLFLGADQLGRWPRSRAGLGLGSSVVVSGHNVPLRIWIDPQGQVVRLVWDPSEVPPDVLDALGRALRALRFEPGQSQGQPVGAVLRVRLCFDDQGRLQAVDPGCWIPDAEPDSATR